MTEEHYRVWDVGIKLGGIIGLIASALIGLYQYRDIREREFYSQFWNERLKLYINSLDAAAKISTAKSSEEFDTKFRDFRTYFDGSMAVVQDPTVDAAMHRFVAQVKKAENNEISKEELGFHSYQLGRTCFESLRDSWNKPFSYPAESSRESPPKQ